MAFPTTGILDNFDRANEGPPPSANWGVAADPNETAGLSVVSNQAEVGGGQGGAHWSASQFGPDVEAFCTMKAGGTSNRLDVRLTNPGTSSQSGYPVVWIRPTDEIKVYRTDSDVYTQLGATITAAEGVDSKLGLKAIGSTISVYNDVGSGWVFVESRTDATYNSVGFIATSGDTGAQLDDFGGGTVATTLPPTLRLARSGARLA